MTAPSPCLLVTGATGFLGGAVAAELINTPHWDSARFMVRAASREEGAGRIRAVLTRFEVAPAALARVRPEQIVLGDLRSTAAMFADPVSHATLASVKRVINCGAVATFSNHPQLWPVNVDGTFEIGRASCRERV